MRTLSFLLLVLPWAAIAETPNIDAFNKRIGTLVGEGEFAERDAKASLQRKIVDDWRVPVVVFEKAVQPLSAANYSIRVGRECSGYAERFLEKKSYADTLHTQAVSAAAFLSDYHFRVLGNNRSLFKVRDVVLCTDPIEPDSSYLAYDRFKAELRLRIGPWLRRLGNLPHLRDNLHPLTADEIRAKWNEGDHYKTEGLFIVEAIDRRKSPIRAYWPYINPIGEIRVALREFIRREGLTRAAALEEAISKKDLSQPILDVLSLAGSDERRKKFVDGNSTENGALNVFFTRWKDKLISPDAAEDMAVASLAALSASITDRTEVERSQVGLINIENFHRIDVNFTAGDARHFQREIEVRRDLTLRVRQRGLINISTGDQVHAFVQLLNVSGNFSKATLRRLLDTL